jgi:hypothetical protein
MVLRISDISGWDIPISPFWTIASGSERRFGIRKPVIEKNGLGLDFLSPVVPNVPSCDVGLGKEFAVTF